jgi:eukaryotic-like serine/threonine-protein kinase
MERAVLQTPLDRYVILEYLAEGGMGAIYLGKKLGMGGFEKEVVLKQLLPEFTEQPEFIDLFLREARLSASLDHANIVRTVDLVNAGDDYFMVMEYVRGGDLRTLMRRARRRRQRFPPQVSVFIGHELLEALAYAHNKAGVDGRPLGLIHRDVSPSNILLSGAGEVKLTDFGIAKASTHRSVFYKVKGKVGYMSPEQARGQTVDVRSDLFSLGVVMWEVIVGERLFVGDLMSSAAQIYSQRITPPSKKRPELPPELDELILRALKLDPNERFQSAQDFQEALARMAARCRLMLSHAEMASQLRQVCGDDPSQWLRLETLGFEEGQTQSQSIPHGTGTAVLSMSGDDEDDDSFGPARIRPPTEKGRQLTSVIALHANDIEFVDEPPLEPLEPRSADTADQTLPQPSSVTAPAEPTAPGQKKRDAGEPTVPGRKSEPTPTGEPTQRRIESQPRARMPTPSGAQTLIRVPGLMQRLQSEDAAPGPASPTSIDPRLPNDPAAARPTMKVKAAKPRPLPRPPMGVAPARPSRKRPLVVLAFVLILIGLGVALGVALSGPEVEVVDPAPPATR